MHTLVLLLVLLTTAAIGDQNGSPTRHQAEDVNKVDENNDLGLMANPQYGNLNDKLERDSFNEFIGETCAVWNQYIPYCSFCTSPM